MLDFKFNWILFILILEQICTQVITPLFVLNYCTIFVDINMCQLLTNVVFWFVYSYVVLTTSGGIMDHEEARRKHLGGKILGFFF